MRNKAVTRACGKGQVTTGCSAAVIVLSSWVLQQSGTAEALTPAYNLSLSYCLGHRQKLIMGRPITEESGEGLNSATGNPML